MSSVFKRLRLRLALILAVAMLPIGALVFYQSLILAHEILADERAALESAANLQVREEREAMTAMRESMRVTATLIGRTGMDVSACTDALVRLSASSPWNTRAAVFDWQGQSHCIGDRRISVDGDPDWEEFKRERSFVLGRPFKGRLSGLKIIRGFYPLETGANPYAALVAGIDLDFLASLSVPENDSPLAELPFALVDNTAAVLVHHGMPNDSWLPRETERIFTTDTITFDADNRDGLTTIYVINPILDGQLWAVTAMPLRSFWDVVLERKAWIVFGPVLLWLVAVLAAYLALTWLVTQHITVLSRAATRIGQGRFNAPMRSLEGAPTEIRELAGALRDMADNLSERDTRLNGLLETQKVLLLEVHHRVKNNLQMISSLLNIETRRTDDPAQRNVLRGVQTRIHGLALVHQTLYAGERLDAVMLDAMVHKLCTQLNQSMSDQKLGQYAFELAPIRVSAAEATPAALFLTEAIANVHKHGAKSSSDAPIGVVLSHDQTTLQLSVRNRLDPAKQNGGVPLQPTEAAEDAGGPTESRLGTRLMDGFAAQLEGTVSRHVTENWFQVTLTAPLRFADAAPSDHL